MAENSDIKGLIFKIRRFSLHDGPGIRTTVFLKGCPLNCIWCHSPEGISDRIIPWHNENICIGCSLCVKSCPNNALLFSAGPVNRITTDYQKCNSSGECVDVCPTEAIQFTGYKSGIPEIISEVVKDRLYYTQSGGGVTLSGGEPLAQPEFSEALLSACRSEAIHTAIETSLYCDPNLLMRIASLTDLMIVDIKLIGEKEHFLYTGKSNKIILDNFKYIATSGTEVLVRIPAIPRLTDSYDRIASVKEFVKSVNSDIPVEILPFNTLARNNYKRLGLPFTLTT